MMVGCTELKKMVKVKFKLRAHPSAVTSGKPDFGVIKLLFFSNFCQSMHVLKVEIFLEQRKVAFLSPSKICENLNFSTVHPEEFKFSQISLGDKNATYLCFKIIST